MNSPTLSPNDLERLLGASHYDPFSVLGPHPVGDRWVVRVFDPHAETVIVEPIEEGAGAAREAVRVHPDGLFEAWLDRPCRYRLRTRAEGREVEERDPYSFGSTLGDLDLYLMGEGRHWDMHHRLGAHLREIDGVPGTGFALWAPNASRVSVVGDFNRWDGRRHMMRLHPANGVWEIFLPGIGPGQHYKFEIRTASGDILLKSDPFAFFSQHGGENASIVAGLGEYRWADDEWMKTRQMTDWQRRPLTVYEVHAGSWARVGEEGNRPLSYRELGDRLLPHVLELGFTHIELMPLAEHPFDGSWGYQVTGYFAPTSRYGRPDELREFVDRCHQAGVGVLMDWVPGHFPRDAHGLARFDGTCLYEHLDPRQGEHRDWGTLIFNYGRAEVRNFLVSNAVYWLEQFHLDGLRVDAVASMLYLDYSREPGAWVPNPHGGRENLDAIAFLRLVNEVCHERFPGAITVAEESTAWPMVSRPTHLGGLGFDFKWNMGWMNDSLLYMGKDPVHRRHHHNSITFSLLYAFHEHFILVLSHDEVVHGKRSLLSKMPGDRWQQFANLRLYLAWMWAHPGKKLLFMGGEFGQWDEWDHDAALQWQLCDQPDHAGLRRLIANLNALLRAEPALYARDDTHEGFEWIDFHDADNSVVSFLRKAGSGDDLLVVVNATPVPRHGYRVGAPVEGRYAELLNTDAAAYGGSGLGNLGGVDSTPTPCHGRPHSVSLLLPPLAALFLRVPAPAGA